MGASECISARLRSACGDTSSERRMNSTGFRTALGSDRAAPCSYPAAADTNVTAFAASLVCRLYLSSSLSRRTNKYCITFACSSRIQRTAYIERQCEQCVSFLNRTHHTPLARHKRAKNPCFARQAAAERAPSAYVGERCLSTLQDDGRGEAAGRRGGDGQGGEQVGGQEGLCAVLRPDDRR